MMRYVFCCLVFCVAGMGLADSSSLWRLGPTPPILPRATSQIDRVPQNKAKPAALTPLEEAEQLYRMGKFDKAIERYNAITGSGSNNAVAFSELARAYLKLGKPNDAYLAATKAVEHEPL